ncbi:MAG: GAF domain-containing protein, partial [Chloroflexota bacterium]
MSFEAIQHLINNINHAPTPQQAARAAVDWLSLKVGAVVVGLLAEDGTAQIVVNEDNPPDPLIMAWVSSDKDWHTLTTVGETRNGAAMIVPLRYGERMFGVLWQHFKTDEIKAKREETVQMLAGIVTTHIHHLRSMDADSEMTEVVDTLARQTARLSAATSVSKVIITHNDIHAMLYSVTELVCYRFGYASVQVMLLTEDKQALEIAMIYTSSGPMEADPDYRLPLSEPGLSTWAVTMDERVVANDVRTHPYYRSDFDIGAVGSQLAIPLRSGTRMQGALVISSYETNTFADPDIEIMQSIADQLAVGINNARLFSEVRARAQDLSALTEISLLVTATLDHEQLAQRVYNAFERLQRPDRFQFVVLDRLAGQLQIESYENGNHTSDRQPFSPSDHLISQIIEQTTPVFWRNQQERETAGAFFRVEQAEYASFLGVPMMAKDSVVGVLCSFSDRPNAFNEHALQVMLTFASSVAVAIDNAELFTYTARRVQELAVINEISHILARSFGKEGFWALIHRQVASLFENSALFIGLHDRQRDMITFPLVSDESMALLPYEPIMRRGGLCDAVLRENSMVLFSDLKSETSRMELMGILPQPDEPGNDRRSWLGVPLQNADGQVIGVVGVNSSNVAQYDDQDSSLLMTVTAQLSLSLQNANLLQSEQKRRQIAGTLIDVGRIVATTLQVDEVLSLILEQMQRVVSFDQATIMLLEEEPIDGAALSVEVSAIYGGSV